MNHGSDIPDKANWFLKTLNAVSNSSLAFLGKRVKNKNHAKQACISVYSY